MEEQALNEARNNGYLVVRERDWETQYVWWNECVRAKKPYLVILPANNLYARVKLDLMPLDSPSGTARLLDSGRDAIQTLCHERVIPQIPRGAKVDLLSDGCIIERIPLNGIDDIATELLKIAREHHSVL